jgi:hypothetical protein
MYYILQRLFEVHINMKITIKYVFPDLVLNSTRSSKKSEYVLELKKNFLTFKKHMNPILNRYLRKSLFDISINDWLVEISIYRDFSTKHDTNFNSTIYVKSKNKCVKGTLIFYNEKELINYVASNSMMVANTHIPFDYVNNILEENPFKNKDKKAYLLIDVNADINHKFEKVNSPLIEKNQVLFEELFKELEIKDIYSFSKEADYCQYQLFLVSDSIQWRHEYRIEKGLPVGRGTTYVGFSKLHPIEQSNKIDFLNSLIEAGLLKVPDDVEIKEENIESIFELSKLLRY